MKKALAALVAAALLLAPAAQATITAPTLLGSANLAAASGNNSIQITTGSDCPVNGLLVVAVLIGSNVRHVTLVQDDSTQTGIANTYSLATEASTSSTTMRQAQSLLTRDVPANSHLTISVTTGNAQPIIAAAACVQPGIASATPDTNVNGTGASATSNNNPHFTAAGSTAQASEIVFDILTWNASTGSVSNWGVDGAGNSFTSVGTIPNGSVGFSMMWAYSIQSTINTPSTSITLSNTENWLVNLYGYKGGTPVVPGGGNQTLMGVGE